MLDALSDFLAPYSEQIGKFAGSITCIQFLSGLALLNDIRKRGSSDAYAAEPFLGGFVLTALSWKIGSLMNDSALAVTNTIGLCINVVFLSVFYYYASNANRAKIWSKMGITAGIIVAILAYGYFEDPEKAAFRLGMLLTVILVFLVGSPLLRLNEFIAKKSTEGLPFPMIVSGSIVATSWAVYGISIRNTVMVFQNLFLLFLSSIQLSLFVIYPNTNSGNRSKSSVQTTKQNVADKKKD